MRIAGYLRWSDQLLHNLCTQRAESTAKAETPAVANVLSVRRSTGTAAIQKSLRPRPWSESAVGFQFRATVPTEPYLSLFFRQYGAWE